MIKNISFKDTFIVVLLCTVIAIFFYGLGSAFVPLTFAWFLAYAAIPLVKKIEKRGLNRSQSSLVVLAIVFVSLILLGLLKIGRAHV